MTLDVLDVTRLQFAVVTIYHYLFVPLSISLSAITAGLHTAWYRTRDEHWRRLTLLSGKLLVVTFAVGVVTGLVQEFQFGMAWSDFARFYGDVFGPTLAIEGMLAFFLEATFLGLWWFGWDRLPRGAHLATIWTVAIGTQVSAFVILAANAFMQNPVAYAYDERTGRAGLTSFTDLLLNEVNLAAYPHTVAGAFMSGGALLLAIGAWRRWASRLPLTAEDARGFGVLARLGAWVTLAGGIATAVSGDHLGKVMTAVQPMKMAAAEALYRTTTGAPFSVFAIGGLDGGEPGVRLDVPRVLSVLATGSPNGTVRGIDDLQAEYVTRFGPGDYVPVVPVAYWSFRLMIGIGMAAAALAAAYLWSTRKGRLLAHEGRVLPDVPRRQRRAVAVALRALWLLPVLPALATTFGWIFTETARQPWIAFGLTTVAEGISPGLTLTEVLVSLGLFAAVYGVLAVVWVRLVLHLARLPLSSEPVGLGAFSLVDDDPDDDPHAGAPAEREPARATVA
ncbi:MAG: cytochrome ubiquinol oxidase subunit I [Kineosporiaceae bacterium]